MRLQDDKHVKMVIVSLALAADIVLNKGTVLMFQICGSFMLPCHLFSAFMVSRTGVAQEEERHLCRSHKPKCQQEVKTQDIRLKK